MLLIQEYFPEAGWGVGGGAEWDEDYSTWRTPPHSLPSLTGRNIKWHTQIHLNFCSTILPEKEKKKNYDRPKFTEKTDLEANAVLIH